MPDGIGRAMIEAPSGEIVEDRARVPNAMAEPVYKEWIDRYADGVTEAMNARDEPFGYGRLEALLKEKSLLTAEQIKGSLLESLDGFRRDRAFGDDVTFVAKVPIEEPLH